MHRELQVHYIQLVNVVLIVGVAKKGVVVRVQKVHFNVCHLFFDPA